MRMLKALLLLRSLPMLLQHRCNLQGCILCVCVGDFQVCSSCKAHYYFTVAFCIAGLGGSALPPSSWEHVGGPASLALRWQKLEGLLGQVGGAEGLFMHLHGQQGAQDTFWLDRYTHTVPAFSTLLSPVSQAVMIRELRWCTGVLTMN